MKHLNSNRHDNELVLPYSDYVQYVATGHTHMHIFDKTDAQINAMLREAQKAARFFTRKFAQFCNGKKALKRRSHEKNPLIISHLHTGSINKASSTIHYHFAFGNLPDWLTEDDMRLIFEELWVKKAEQSDKTLWLRQANSDSKSWLHYGHRENRFGNLLGLDIFSTHIPHDAFPSSLSSVR